MSGRLAFGETSANDSALCSLIGSICGVRHHKVRAERRSKLLRSLAYDYKERTYLLL